VKWGGFAVVATVGVTIVGGSWNRMLEMVNMKIGTEWLLLRRSRSASIDVTEVDEMMPLSRRLKLQINLATVHRRISTILIRCVSAAKYSSEA